MLHWADTFFIISITAALLGFAGIAGSIMEIVRILFFAFLFLSILVFFLGKTRVRTQDTL